MKFDAIRTAFAVAVYLIVLSSSVSAENTPQHVAIGHSSGKSVTYAPVSGTDTCGSAIHYSADYMRAYAGSKITSVQVYLNDRTGKDSVSVFVARSLDEPPLYEQKYTAPKRGMNTIIFDKPFEITGDALYIGYTVVGTKYLSYSNPFVEGEEWIWNKAEGWKKYEDIYSATMLVNVEGDNLPEDVNIGQVTMNNYTLVNQSLPCSGIFKNLGASTVNALTFTYYVDGKEYATETVSDLNIASRKADRFKLSTLQLKEEGKPTVRIELTAVNGKPDGHPSDNVTEERRVLCRHSFVKRKTLVEIFSTELCANCPSVHASIDKVLDGKDDVVEIGHHAGFYTDSLTIPVSVDYEWFYKTNRLYAPAMMFDRTCMSENYPSVYSENVPVVGGSGSNCSALYEVARDIPAFASVTLSKTLDESSRQLNVHVEGNELIAGETPANPRLYVFLTEDSIFSTTQSGSGGEYYHRYSVRRSLTGTWGDDVDLVEGFSKDYKASLPKEWDMSKMRVVAFVANYNADDKNDCRVLNVDEVKLIDKASSIQTVSADRLVSLVDGKVSVVGEGCRFSLYDIHGKCVIEGNRTTPLPSLAHGVYILKVSEPSMGYKVKVAL